MGGCFCLKLTLLKSLEVAVQARFLPSLCLGGWPVFNLLPLSPKYTLYYLHFDNVDGPYKHSSFVASTVLSLIAGGTMAEGEAALSSSSVLPLAASRSYCKAAGTFGWGTSRDARPQPHAQTCSTLENLQP